MSDTPRLTGAPVPDFTPPPMPGPARIEGRFVTLERLDPARHAEAIWQAARGADWIWDYLGYGPFAAPEDYRAWADGVASGADPCFYAVLPDQDAAGVASFLRIDPNNGVAELGHILLTPRVQRTPAASEALMLMIRWAFENGYRRFEWKCDALNAPSRRAALRLGFTFEGVFRKHMIYKGRNRDTAWFAITDDEWPALRGAYDAWLAPANFDAEGRQRESLSALTVRALPGRG
ncbi:MAG: GNAT family protein [Paracoccus sp. (in: a-proteobacteria)]|uniref:GNAT family N-acetyltransferase n=1 Tax=Paracoccus sp. TaxID=267 RepID=UPI0026DECDC7|nr:GNAT family protein [Paracoccus sp. (in: a-proteobacteria)]MDO5613128.1 GNAT family protein [Paracoccus sp. (in: a-proteobacteria)]